MCFISINTVMTPGFQKEDDMPYAKSFNKKTGTACVYEILENRWDPDKGCPVSKRKLIGTIDPETGKIVPARKRGSKDKQYNVPSDLTAPGVCSEPSDNQQLRKLLADELA